MKKIVVLLMVVSFVLISCNITGQDILNKKNYQEDLFNKNTDQEISLLVEGHELFYSEFPGLKTFEDIADYINNLIVYKNNETNIILNPEEILLKGVGNYYEYAILFMNIAYVTLNVKFDFVAAYANASDQRTILEGGTINHAVVSLDGKLYSTQYGTPITDYNACYFFTFERVFNIN